MVNSDKEKPTRKSHRGFAPEDLEKRVVKSFLDILILIEMKKQSNLSGYDVIAFINNKFSGVLSPGTVYSTLYALERRGLIKGEWDGRKTVYQLTNEGQRVITRMMENFNEKINDFVRKFLTI
ncbi:MAG: PadR family transcriptional regulator [Candidatus Bathyarchaeia archaeon]